MNNPKVPDAVMDAMLDIIGGDASGGFIDVYNGTQPTNGGDPLSGQVLLVSFPLPSPAFPAASGKILTANPIPNENAVANGNATWFRMYKSDHTTPIFDGSAGVPQPGNDFDLELANDDMIIGQAQGIAACVIRGNN